MTDLSTLMLVIVVAYLSERWRPIVAAKFERPKAVVQEPVPVAIVQLAQEYDTEWAQEEFLRRASELYAELRDWNSVYARLSSLR